MTKGSNAGIYWFWGLVLAIIVIVLVIIFIPKTPSDASLTNISKTTEAYENTISTSPTQTTIDTYVEDILNWDKVNQSNKDCLEYNNSILEMYFQSNSFLKKALLFVDNNKNYAPLVQKQNEYVAKIQENISTLQNYCKTTIKSFINNPDCDSSIVNNNIVKKFNEQYYELVSNFANYYVISAEIVQKCSVRCFEINELTITTNSELASALQRLLTNVNNSELADAQQYANEFYTDTYYLEYYTGTNPETLKTELQNLGGKQ